MTRAVPLVVALLLGTAGVLVAPAAAAPADTSACVGPVERPAEGETVVAAQGLKLLGDTYTKRPALLVGYDGEARPAWSRNLSSRGRFLTRSVSAVDDGTLLVTTEAEHTVVERRGPDHELVWALRFGLGDGPRSDIDVRDALSESEGLLLAADRRLLRYDRETDRILREWPLPGDAFPDEESHVTGVAPAPEGYLVTVAGNGTGSLLSVDDEGVNWRVDGLGGPHTPQHLGETVLVAETAENRVVELRPNGTRVWSLAGFDRPRSAERLPGGTTLVADRRNHRVVEVGPSGRVLWTALAPWEPVGATRRVTGERPSMLASNASAGSEVGTVNASYGTLEACEVGLLALAPNDTERAATLAAADRRTPIAAVTILALAAAAVAYRRY